MAISTNSIVTLANTKTYLGITSTTDDALLELLIDRSSAQIQRYLGRSLVSQTLVEWYDTYGADRLNLKQNPAENIRFVGIGSTAVMSVSSSLSTDLFASISVNDVHVHLYRVSSTGSEFQTTITFASQDTTAEMATAISATTGFTATSLLSAPSKYLRKIAGRELKNSTATLTAAIDSLSDYQVDYERGIIYGASLCAYQSMLVEYTGGYSEIPFDLQQEAIDMTGRAYRGRLRDGGLASESLGGYSYSVRATVEIDAASKRVLDSYRRLR